MLLNTNLDFAVTLTLYLNLIFGFSNKFSPIIEFWHYIEKMNSISIASHTLVCFDRE